MASGAAEPGRCWAVKAAEGTQKPEDPTIRASHTRANLPTERESVGDAKTATCLSLDFPDEGLERRRISFRQARPGDDWQCPCRLIKGLQRVRCEAGQDNPRPLLVPFPESPAGEAIEVLVSTHSEADLPLAVAANNYGPDSGPTFTEPAMPDLTPISELTKMIWMSNTDCDRGLGDRFCLLALGTADHGQAPKFRRHRIAGCNDIVPRLRSWLVPAARCQGKKDDGETSDLLMLPDIANL